MELQIKQVSENELDEFLTILKDAAYWLKTEGMEMWNESHLTREIMLRSYLVEEMFIGIINNEAAATMILQEQDLIFWPNKQEKDSLFLHKLSVRRKYAKTGLSSEMINWAKQRAKNLNKSYLRLDCIADRPKLCEFYQSQNFKKVDEKMMFGKYPTAFFEFKII